MAGWHHLTDRKTGETCVVASLAGIDAKRWAAAPLPGPPGEFEAWDAAAKVFREDMQVKDRSGRRAAALARGDSVDLLLDLEDRVRALEAKVK